MQYAKIKDGIVENVILADDEFIATMPGEWVDCTGVECGIGWSFDGLDYHAPDTPEAPLPVPQSATRKQARKALALAGLFDAVQPAIDAIADPLERQLAQIDWDDAQDFERSDPFLSAMAAALSLDAEALDALFVAAGEL